jgi:hypothetical protein
MPTYLLQSEISQLNNFGNFSGNSTASACCAPEACQSSLLFFNALSGKMLDMVSTLKQQFAECAANATNTVASGFFLVKISTKSGTLGVKLEYVEYIKRYGPPTDGIFDETLLQQLRDELGISETSNTI